MDYKEKYEQALERASKLRVQNPFDTVGQMVEHIFPDLQESEDERIRKSIISILKGEIRYISIEDTNKYVTWLENQAEQSTDKIEPNPDWSETDEEMLTWLCRIIHSQRLDRAITLKEESELGEWIDKWLNYNPQTKQCEHLENYDEEERIRKVLLNDFKNNCSEYYCEGVNRDMIIAWLEKQGDKDKLIKEYEKYINWLEKQSEQKSSDFSDIRTWKYIVDMVLTEKDGIGNYLDNPDTEHVAKKLQEKYGNIEKQSEKDPCIGCTNDKGCVTCENSNLKEIKVEPKFHEGEWIIHQGTENIYQVIARIDNQYQLKYGDNYTIQKCADVDRGARLWTIQDAKDGDVLTNGEIIVIFKQIVEPKYRQHIEAYIGLDLGCNIQVTSESWSLGIDKTMPATKEQRDLLFQKMKDAGYEWNSEKKQLSILNLGC